MIVCALIVEWKKGINMDKCKCGKERKEDHTCPFAEEINNDNDSLCNCCKDCIRNCAMDI